MIEIVFGQSAEGSLKIAQHYGEGEYQPSCIGFVNEEQGEEPDPETIEQMRQKFLEKEKKEWESAVPLGGQAADVFGFSLGFAMGELSENMMGEQRRKTIMQLLGKQMQKPLEQAERNLEQIHKRVQQDEPVRIWYSEQPEECCGMCWFCAQLHQWQQYGPVFLVKLPNWIEEGKTLVQYSGWGEVQLKNWGKLAQMQQQVGAGFVQGAAGAWNQLCCENAPLRVLLNGRIQSVSSDFYDPYIELELKQQPEEFYEAQLIGSVIGKYGLRIGDGWLAMRIEQMVRDGKLAFVRWADPENPEGYRRWLKKL